MGIFKVIVEVTFQAFTPLTPTGICNIIVWQHAPDFTEDRTYKPG
jgi:hypothetical protein